MSALSRNDTLKQCNASSNGLLTSVSVFTPSIMFAFGVGGNMLALCFLCRSRNASDKGQFYRLVLALSITDMLGIVTTSPVVIAVYQNNLHWLGGSVLCNYFGFMLTFAGISTPLLIGAMTIERYLAICYPLHYNLKVNKNYSRYAFVCTWSISFFFALMPLLGFGKNVLQFPGTWCFFDFRADAIEDQIFAYLYASVVLSVILLIVICNVSVIMTLLRAHRKQRRMRLKEEKQGRARRWETSLHLQMIAMLIGVMIVFAVCWTPLLVRIVINQSRTLPTNRYADLIAIRLASLNQIMDPWVYIFLRRQLFRQIKRLVLRITCQKVKKPSRDLPMHLPLPDLIDERNQKLYCCRANSPCVCCFRQYSNKTRPRPLLRHNSDFSSFSTRVTCQSDVCISATDLNYLRNTKENLSMVKEDTEEKETQN